MRKLKRGFRWEKIPRAPSSNYQVPENHLDWNTGASVDRQPPQPSSSHIIPGYISWLSARSYESTVMESNYAGHCQQRQTQLIKKLCLVVSILISANYADPPVKSGAWAKPGRACEETKEDGDARITSPVLKTLQVNDTSCCVPCCPSNSFNSPVGRKGLKLERRGGAWAAHQFSLEFHSKKPHGHSFGMAMLRSDSALGPDHFPLHISFHAAGG